MEFMLEQYKLPQLGEKISNLHGKLLTAKASFGEFTILPLYHPAAAFYNRDLEKVMEEDMQTFKGFLQTAGVVPSIY